MHAALYAAPIALRARRPQNRTFDPKDEQRLNSCLAAVAEPVQDRVEVVEVDARLASELALNLA